MRSRQCCLSGGLARRPPWIAHIVEQASTAWREVESAASLRSVLVANRGKVTLVVAALCSQQERRGVVDNPTARTGVSAAMHRLATYWTYTARRALELSLWRLGWPASPARSFAFHLLPCCSHCQGRSPHRLWRSTGEATVRPLPPSTRTFPLQDDQIETPFSRGGLKIRNNLQISTKKPSLRPSMPRQ